MLSANPKDSTPLRLDEEVREIEAGLQRAQNREQFELHQKWALRPRDIHRAMLDVDPQIVHFSGHGVGEEGLVFEDDIRQAKLIDGEALAGLFKLFPKVECVLLNACYSEIQAKAIAKHIPYVIGMNQAIGDKAAIEFAVAFYDALGAGRNVNDAFKFGCNAIRMAGIVGYLKPVLIRNSSPAFSASQDNFTITSIRPLVESKTVDSLCATQSSLGAISFLSDLEKAQKSYDLIIEELDDETKKYHALIKQLINAPQRIRPDLEKELEQCVTKRGCLIHARNYAEDYLNIILESAQSKVSSEVGGKLR